MSCLLHVILLSAAPGVEVRGSIPYALTFCKSPYAVPLAVLVTTITGFIIYFTLEFAERRVIRRVRFLERIYDKIIFRVREKAKKYVERYGTLGLTLFVAIPLPGSGVWSGALAAYLFDFKPSQTLLALTLGNLIASTIVYLTTYAVKGSL